MFGLQRLGLHNFASGDGENNGLNPAMLDALQVWVSRNHVGENVDRSSENYGNWWKCVIGIHLVFLGTGHFSAWKTGFFWGRWGAEDAIMDLQVRFLQQKGMRFPRFHTQPLYFAKRVFLMSGQGWCQSGHFEAKTLKQLGSSKDLEPLIQQSEVGAKKKQEINMGWKYSKLCGYIGW